jgi:predicted lipid-binding transport protein (Tim44 family)
LEDIAFREGEMVKAGQNHRAEFITVKFYANFLENLADEKNGQILSGTSNDPVKFIGYWTFSRNMGERNWVLAGISQEGDLSFNSN